MLYSITNLINKVINFLINNFVFNINQSHIFKKLKILQRKIKTSLIFDGFQAFWAKMLFQEVFNDLITSNDSILFSENNFGGIL